MILWNNLILRNNSVLRNDWILRNNSILQDNLILGKTRFSRILEFCRRPDLTEYPLLIPSDIFIHHHLHVVSVQYITETRGGQERTKMLEISVAAVCTSVK